MEIIETKTICITDQSTGSEKNTFKLHGCPVSLRLERWHGKTQPDYSININVDEIDTIVAVLLKAKLLLS